MTSSDALPIDALRADFATAIARGPVVVTSPTGSGKSTQLPRWCDGPVMVVEPRRLACRALAARVAELEGTDLGDRVGYAVRDERRASERTQILFVTPGIALRMTSSWAAQRTVVLDEFHERSLETDLLLALLQRRYQGGLVVMSATMDGDRVAAHLGGAHLRAEVRTHPVTIRHLADGPAQLPTREGLDARIVAALDACRGDPGDVLVFLPGKGEIADCARALRGARDVDVLPLHGGLTLDEQRRAFSPSSRRKVVLSTNVAETSVTIPGIGVVIDAGLVRQTRYRDGRASLTLTAIARDSAEQRAGRAGRTGPGVCYRLWSAAAKLTPTTPPELHRESLVPLVLAAAACGEVPETLPWLDPPKAHGLAAARAELTALGALDVARGITERGRELFGLPLDAHLGRLLVEARRTGALADVIDLVAVLSTGRSLFLADDGDAWRESGCDVTAMVRALRSDDDTGLHRGVLDEARRASARLRRQHGLPERGAPDASVDRDLVARTALAADPRCAHVARPRGREVMWSNGGTELSLGRESAVRRARDVEYLAALDARSFGDGRDETLRITCATPLRVEWLVAAGLGADRIAAARVERGRVTARVERVYAGKVLAERDEVPEGDAARDAIAMLFTRGSIFRESLAETTERLAATSLAARLHASGKPFPGWTPPTVVDGDVAAWTRARVAALGVERGDDLAMLGPGDFLADALPDDVRAGLDKEYPRRVTVGDASYEARYDVATRTVTLRMVRGTRKDAPPLGYLPRFPGFRIVVESGRATWVVRAQG